MLRFDPAWRKDPGVFRVGRLEAHSDHISFASREEAEAGKSSLRMSLNGAWKFFCAKNEAQIVRGFEEKDFDLGGWDEIPVPAHIQMEGWGVPQYCNIRYPWDGHESPEVGEPPREFDPVACYAKDLYIPDTWQGKRICISFQGAESCIALWCNGDFVGYASGSYLPAEFELTEYLVPGRNRIACRVYRFCAGSWLEDQDYFRFSGLFREVFLYAVPERHLRDITIRTLLDEDMENARLCVESDVQGPETLLTYELTAPGVSSVTWESAPGPSERAIASPRLWSAEDPFLYDLRITLRDPAGNVSEVVRQKVGFRRFEIRNAQMLLNGKRIVFKGTNRHDFCAETGRAVTYETVRRDLISMKRMNINAVRTSHYPNASFLYDIADELGLYVIDEADLETHAMWDRVESGRIPLSEMLPGDRPEWQPVLLDRAEGLYRRDRNHPCVLIWSCGNESLGGSLIREMSMCFRELDPDRPVHYEGVSHDPRYPETTDIDCSMYLPIWELKRYLKDHREKPFILTEYVHAMGNSCGDMYKYTEYAYEEPLYQGGFIWDFIDQSIRKEAPGGGVMYGYGGDFGDRPNDGNFSGDGILYGNGEESPKVQEVRFNYQDIVATVEPERVVIGNRAMFTSTGAYECVASLALDGQEIARTVLENDVAPGKKERIPLPFGVGTVGGEYCITLSWRLKEDRPWAERGYEVAFAQGVYRVAGQAQIPEHPPIRVTYGDQSIGVKGDCFEVLFDLGLCALSSYRYCGREYIDLMPSADFWRAPTDNDRGNGMPFRYAQWKIASLYASPVRGSGGTDVREHADGSVSVSFRFRMPAEGSPEYGTEYRVHPDGTVAVTLRYDPVPGMGDPPVFGMLFRLPRELENIRWYGLGPEENYADRLSGARLGIFRTKVTENLSHYLIPQECGNRTGVRWAEVTDHRGRGLRFSGECMEFSALPWTPHELENALHEYELPPRVRTVVRCAMRQMGVGGDDSWGARTHEEYLIDITRPLEFTFFMTGIL